MKMIADALLFWVYFGLSAVAGGTNGSGLIFVCAPLAYDIRLCSSSRRPDRLSHADLAIERYSN
jgi:hypothetical protein